MKRKLPTPAAAPQRPLRLEYVEAGSLTENPLNWRRHPPAQVNALRDMLKEPEVGWAGALLFNEQTGRLIDGHARKKSVSPDTVVPVLIGSWSEEAERKILATLDPLAAMAQSDSQAYQDLQESFTTDSLWVRELVRLTAKESEAQADADLEDQQQPADDAALVADMELQPFEHYDYIVLLFKNDQDFSAACEKLGIQKVKVEYASGLNKIGLGRVIDGAKVLQRLP